MKSGTKMKIVNIKKMLKYFSVIALSVLTVIIQSCSDCNLVTANYPCTPREATVTQFDPRVSVVINGNDTTIVPVPTYSIQTFLFPSDNSSSGSLTNDNRFSQTDTTKQKVVIAEKQFTYAGRQLIAQLVSIHPTNSSLVGDMMVIDVDMTASPPAALLRFYGLLAIFPFTLQSEDASLFCADIENYRGSDNDFNNIKGRSTEFGKGLPNAVNSSFTSSDIRVLDMNNNDVTFIYSGNIPKDVKDSLLSASTSQAVDILVQPGQMYYYRARNGKDFAVLIADIREGTFSPNLKRVTIKFSEIRGSDKTDCKP
jgi:hypothetical protein